MTFLRKKDFPNFTAVAPHLGMLLPHVVRNPSIFLCVFPVAAATPGSFWLLRAHFSPHRRNFPAVYSQRERRPLFTKGFRPVVKLGCSVDVLRRQVSTRLSCFEIDMKLLEPSFHLV